MAKVISDLFSYSSFDDNPYASGEMTFDDGSTVTAKTHSYYAFMIPWTISDRGDTFNTAISRTFSALLPPKTTNKQRLVADEFVSKLAETLLQRIEPEWKMRGVEDREREDLISVVQAQQPQIALLHVGFVYWLLFPDKHMLLWRFEGPRGFLKWKPSDFPAGKCGEYYWVNDGGCSGREISPDGELLPDHEPNDVSCMTSFKKT